MRRLFLGSFLWVAIGAPAALAQPPAAPAFDEVLDTTTIGAASFLKAHPDQDGRGVVIAVLDTGVDPGAPGLQTTSTGLPKVIEARDFTGESVIDLEPATREVPADGRPLWRAKGAWVRGVDAIPGLPADAQVHLGFLDESRFKNTPVSDLDGDGKPDGRLAVAVFRGADGDWRAVLDHDGDHDLAAEPVLKSFDKERQTVRLGAGGDPARDLARVPVSVTLGDDAPRRVELHVVAGSHGTHVAGIAAGHGLNGQDGFDGVAPGAQVLSLKIGDSTLAGGASVTDSMKRALEFAARWGRQHKVPVVANVSYGVGSETEGESDIDRFLERFQEENPQVVVVCSAGNNGPGLSTVGTPGASRGAIAVAAVLTPRLASELVGSPGASLQVFPFSSRGGEVPKPDVAAPGIASSSVPPWEKRDVMRGTSMAAPEASGAVALVLSAFQAGGPGRPWHAGMVRQALRDGARPVPGFGVLDQGSGLLDVARTLAALESLSGSPAARWVASLDAFTESPTLGARKAGGAFWRAGGYAPGPADPVELTLKARYLADAPGDVRNTGWVRLSLSADAPWIRLSQGSLALRGSEPSVVRLWIDRARVATPGVHAGTVTARAPGGPAVRIPVSVVVPERVDTPPDGLPRIQRRGLSLAPGAVARLFLAPPPGTTTVSFHVRGAPGRTAQATALLYDGAGRKIPLDGRIASAEGAEARWALSPADLADGGTLELDLVGAYAPAVASTLDLDVRFGSLAVDVPPALRAEPGKAPAADLSVTNTGAVPFDGDVRGEIRGYERSVTRVMDGDVLKQGFTTSPEVESVEYEMELSADDWARFTDIAVNVLAKDGKAAVQTGFSQRRLKVLVKATPGATEDWTLEIRGGRAQRGSAAAEIRLVERYVLRERVPLAGAVEGAQRVRLWPSLRARVRVQAASTPKAPPAGTAWSGTLDFTDRRDGTPWLRLPLRVTP